MKYIALVASIYILFTQELTIHNVLLILFILWTIPLNYFRVNFRKIIYQTNDWKIALKPIFVKEIKGLILNIYPDNKKYIKYRNFYRFYLIMFFLLYTLWRVTS